MLLAPSATKALEKHTQKYREALEERARKIAQKSRNMPFVGAGNVVGENVNEAAHQLLQEWLSAMGDVMNECQGQSKYCHDPTTEFTDDAVRQIDEAERHLRDCLLDRAVDVAVSLQQGEFQRPTVQASHVRRALHQMIQQLAISEPCNRGCVPHAAGSVS